MTLDARRREALQALGVGTFEFDAPLARWTALGIGGPADAVVRGLPDEEARALLRRWCRRERLAVLDVPTGPDVLVRDGGLRGVFVLPEPEPTPTRSCRLFCDPEPAVPASRLLSEAGLAGVRLRGARLAEADPNLVETSPDASARDVLALVEWAQRQVEVRTGVKLELALEVVGRP